MVNKHGQTTISNDGEGASTDALPLPGGVGVGQEAVLSLSFRTVSTSPVAIRRSDFGYRDLPHPLTAAAGATIVKHLDIVHPAARTLVDIARSQDSEVHSPTVSSCPILSFFSLPG